MLYKHYAEQAANLSSTNVVPVGTGRQYGRKQETARWCWAKLVVPTHRRGRHRNSVLNGAVEIETVLPPLEGRPLARFNEPLRKVQVNVVQEIPTNRYTPVVVSGSQGWQMSSSAAPKCARSVSAVDELRA